MLDPVFASAVQTTLVAEGVLSDNPNDHGGLTKYGITQASWTAYVAKADPKGLLPHSVRGITRDQAIEFYRTEFWLAAGCNKIPAEIAPAVFDFAVNSGVRRALAYYKLLKLQGHEQGVALRKARNNYVAMRGRFLMNICQRDHSQITFVEGWFNRIIGQLDFAY
jgi:lysozyme family protein